MENPRELTVKEVEGWFKRIVEGNSRAYSSRTIHVSELAICLRRSWYARRRAKTTPTEALALVFGSSIHRALQEYLGGQGWDAEIEVEYKAREYRIVGHVDLVNPSRQLALELKTVKRLPERPLGHHILQLNAYLYMLKLPIGYIVYLGKEDSKIRLYKHYRDEWLWKRLLRRAETYWRFLKLGKPPKPEISRHCAFCPHNWQCFESWGERL